MTTETKSRKSWPLILLALNAVGAIAYLILASRGGWVIPQECEAGIHTTTGEPIVWFGSIAPVITVFFFLNLVWGIMILRRREWASGRTWMAAAAIWVIAASIDFSHHQC